MSLEKEKMLEFLKHLKQRKIRKFIMILSENKIRNIIKRLVLNEYRKASQGKPDYNAPGLKRGLDIKKASKEKYSFDDLPFTYSQVSMSQAAAVAKNIHSKIGAASPKVKEGDEANHQKIVDLVHKPAYKMFRGGAMDAKTEESYVKGLKSKAWSSWFLNRCYESDNPGFEQIKKSALGFTDSGCCYPYAYAAKNRAKLMNEPEKLQGKQILILVSKEEIDKVPEFSLEAGVASVVGQGGPNPDWENIRQSFELKGGEKHMNIYTGSTWIGGNLGDSTSDKPNDNNANGFMILVNVGNSTREADAKEKTDMTPGSKDDSNSTGLTRPSKSFLPTIKDIFAGNQGPASEKFNVKNAQMLSFDGTKGSKYQVTMSVNDDTLASNLGIKQDILIKVIIKSFDSAKLKAGDVTFESEEDTRNLELSLAKKIVNLINNK